MSRNRFLIAFFACGLVATSSAQAQTCPVCVPLTDLGHGLYLGLYEGGLYREGSNAPPIAHLNAALRIARTIVPLDATGAPDDQNGVIGFTSIGMSNTSQEFGVFEGLELTNPSKNPKLVVLNTAQGGQSADRINSADAPYWQFVLDTIGQSGMTPARADRLGQAGPCHSTSCHPPNMPWRFKEIFAGLCAISKRYSRT